VEIQAPIRMAQIERLSDEVNPAPLWVNHKSLARGFCFVFEALEDQSAEFQHRVHLRE